MQAIEFKTTLQNGTVTIPSEYSDQWEGKTIRVILLDDVPPSPSPAIESTLAGIAQDSISPSTTAQTIAPSDSLFTRLKQIEIDGPSDFSENIDAYLNGEKDA